MGACRRRTTTSAAAVRTAAATSAITIGVVELPPELPEDPGTPATPLSGCPESAASLATAVIAACARALLVGPAGLRNAVTAAAVAQKLIGIDQVAMISISIWVIAA